MHQQRRSHCRDLDYNRLSNERPKSCVKRENTLANLPQVPAHMGLSQVLPSKTMVPRPQTSCAKKTGIQHQTSRPQVRAKSAHPRLLQAAKYMHTNASKKQLQVGTEERGLETVRQGSFLSSSCFHFYFLPITLFLPLSQSTRTIF